jgi:putrescine transport system permease protein
VWSGFSFKWYGALLLQTAQMLDAAWISIKIAFLSASASVVLGTMAALAMTRLRRFPGKTCSGALITAPTGDAGSDHRLVDPAAVRGAWRSDRVCAQGYCLSIWIAHVTFTLAFVTVVVSSRLAELDRSLEEAAMDLGANRIKVFFLITLPIIAPALVSGWLLAFTLSLDDVVISSFVAGPSSTTLPMKVFSSVRLGLSPKINALATLMIAVVAVAAFIAWWMMAREDKRRQLDMQMAAKDN